MPGERDLETLLTHAAPRLREDVYVFCSQPEGVSLPLGLQPVMQFREDEGTTLVILRDDALRLGWAHEFPCRWITLSVDSALDAVGFLAVVTARLAAAGIAVNAVSALRHDHLFVPENRAEEAMRALSLLAAWTPPRRRGRRG